MSGYDLNLIGVWWKICLVVFNGSLMKRVHFESSRTIICYILNDFNVSSFCPGTMDGV